MRPLPRVHAFTDRTILSAPDFGIRAAAIAAAGAAVALHARDRGDPGAGLAASVLRMVALARPPEAAVFVAAGPISPRRAEHMEFSSVTTTLGRSMHGGCYRMVGSDVRCMASKRRGRP